MIHQDFSVTGTGPVVEIFERRIEITNPGTPLVDVWRIIDNPPKSRNEKLAELMRRLGMCEELGTGWDKIVINAELAQLPAPRIDLYADSTRVTLFSKIPFSSISLEEKLWACYLHACIKQVQGEQLTNSSLRNRFGVEDSSAASISRLIRAALDRNGNDRIRRGEKMAGKYKFSGAELEEIRAVRRRNTNKRAEARLKALELRAGEKQERIWSHYRFPSSGYRNTDSEIPCQRDRGNQREPLRRNPPEHEPGVGSGTAGRIRKTKRRRKNCGSIGN